jgi:rhomboid protease GluP
MLRQRSGSSLCYACGRLNHVGAARCFHCGARRPGLWGFGPSIGRLVGRLGFARLVTVACVALYALALALDPAAALRPRGLFGILAPSARALDLLGMTGAYAWGQGRWWTLLTAIYLHGGLLHLLFNLIWIHQLAPAVEETFGRARLVLIFTASGVAGYALSVAAGLGFSVGASGAVFGLLGAMVCYGRARGGWFGMAVFRQYGQWALLLLVFGFLMPGVNNLAHVGGFAGGYVAALALGHGERAAERGAHGVLAGGALALTGVAFALALWTGLAG